MRYSDRVYGKVEITEPVVLDLLKSPSLQRLKGISQQGYFEPHFPGTSYSRFEHSVGVYHLLNRFGASLEEQIAGLIHDVSHAAFSHCIDYVLAEASGDRQDHQDAIFKNFVRKTEIPGILNKYSLDVDYILEETNFPLKERNLPNLCADRIDYFLREAAVHAEIDQEKIDYFLETLTIMERNWVIRDLRSAKEFAALYLRLNLKYWAGFPSAVMFQTVGDCLRYCLEKNYFSFEDLYTTDKNLLKKIKLNLDNDENLKTLFDRMSNRTTVSNDSLNYQTLVLCKSRVVDPLCFHEGKLKLISEIEPEWARVVERELSPKKYFLRFKTPDQ
jgi:HD superfamily phosphohydrolase